MIFGKRTPTSADGVQDTMTTPDHEHAPTPEEIQAFKGAWAVQNETNGLLGGGAPEGTRTAAGLRAANALRDERLAKTATVSESDARYHIAAELKALASHLRGRSAEVMLHGILARAHDLDHGGAWVEGTTEPTETAPGLDPRPWRITHGAGAYTAGSRVRDGAVIHPEARFVFDPRDAYTQEPDQYPEKDYGPVRKHTTPLQGKLVYRSVVNPTTVAPSMAAVTKALDTMREHNTRPNTPRAEGLRTNIHSLLALRDISPENQELLSASVNELAALAMPEPEITDDEIYAERQNQISKGYSARHDDEHGLRHLLLWSIQYAKRRKPVEAAALIRAALESMARKGLDL